jgi:hypothetical protein
MSDFNGLRDLAEFVASQQARAMHPTVEKIDGNYYLITADGKLTSLGSYAEPYRLPIKITATKTLAGLVDYIKAQKDLQPEGSYIQVHSYREVAFTDRQWDRLTHAKADAMHISDGISGLNTELAIREIRRTFRPTETRAQLLDLVGGLGTKKTLTAKDTGIAITYESMEGIIEHARIDPEIKLHPRAGFGDVEIPEASYGVRVEKEGGLMLFRIPDPIWDIVAARAVTDYLKAALPEWPIIG